MQWPAPDVAVAVLQAALLAADQARGLALQYGAALYSLTEAVAAGCAAPLRVCDPTGLRSRVLGVDARTRAAALPPNTSRIGVACWGEDSYTFVWCTGPWPIGLVPAAGAVLVGCPSVIDTALAHLQRPATPIAHGNGLVAVKLSC